MKKVVMCIVLLCFIFFVACGKKENSKEVNKKKEKSTIEEVSRKKSKKALEKNKWNVINYEGLDDIIYIDELEMNNSDIVNAPVKTYEIKYKSDDCEVTSFLAVPEETLKNKSSCACIIYNRDGYKENNANVSTTIIDLASFFNATVFATQYRGNTTSTGVDQFGGLDVNDVIKLIDLCEEFAFVDMSKIYMTGVGRGGMMTYMAAKCDKRISKIAVKGGMTDLFTTATYNPSMQEVFRECVGGIPSEIPQEFINRSAIYWPQNITCPTLIIHGRYDTKVSYQEATKMAEGLTSVGTILNFITNENDINSYQLSDFQHIKVWFGLA